jgi:hypothetical protein
MPKSIVIDEIHVHVYASRGLPTAEYDRMVQALNRSGFLPQMRAAVRGVFRRYPALRKARVVLSR